MIDNAMAALSWTGKVHAYIPPLPDRGSGETLCQRTSVRTSPSPFAVSGTTPMGKAFPLAEDDLVEMPNPENKQGVAERMSHCGFCLSIVDPPNVCTRTRDLLEHDPELAGKIIVGCDRRALHTGKHRDSAKAVEWWG